MKKCIILANGKPPKKSIITFFQRRGYEKLICADGGANSALKMNIIPDVIIGDLDSISSEALKEFKSVSKIIQLKRQNDTDVEKCLKYAISKKYDEALLVGVTGNRLDHTFCNLGIVLKFFHQIKISLIAEDSFLKAYTNNVELKTTPGETISFYGISEKTKITSKGLKYELKNAALPFGIRESTSNIAKKVSVKLKITNGVVFIIRDVNLMIKHDLF
jgi:thiamine pyrophosphokinase